MSLFRFALRQLAKTPFVSLVAVLSLALGIGANSAIFSLFHELLLQPLPVHAPEELVALGSPGPKPGSQSTSGTGGMDEIFSYPMFRDLQREGDEVVELAAHRSFSANLAFEGSVQGGEGVLVSGSYFPVLGLAPAAGRLLSPSDDQVVGESAVVVLSHEYWSSRFGSDESVVGKILTVNGEPMTIVGVAPEGFSGASRGTQPEVYLPITMRGEISRFDGFENRRNYWAYVFGRLRPDVELETALAQLDARYRAIVTEVEVPLQEGMGEKTMEQFRSKGLAMEPSPRGQSQFQDEAKTPMLLLFAVTGIVLLIACANVANLLLARAATRRSEMAVRLSIGAGRGRLVLQLLAEACVLAALGGLAGVGVAVATLRGIGSLLPAGTAEILDLRLDPAALAFTAGIALLTGLVFGLYPALHSTRMDLASTMKGDAGQPAGARSAARFRTGLVVAQIALATTLLVAAGLFLRSLLEVSRVDLGLEAENVITFWVAPERNGYEAERSRELFRRAEEELAALPGVESVSASLVPLLAHSNWGTDILVEGFEVTPETNNNSRFNEVGPGYFHTLGVPLLAGREFTDQDILDRPKVAVVNQAFAERFGLGRDAVGKRMSRETGPDAELDIEIVGLVQNAKYSEVKGEIPPLFFTPYRQDESIGWIHFYVRTALTPQSLMPSVRSVIAGLDPNLPVEDLKTLPQQVEENVFLDRFLTSLAAAFALLATVLAAVGLYGVLAYTVTQRRREFGLRMALGADGGNVCRLVLGQLGRLTLVGGVLGLAGAYGLGRVAGSLLYEVEGHDPQALVLSVLLLGTVALVAGLAPALRAARVDPMTSLRYE